MKRRLHTSILFTSFLLLLGSCKGHKSISQAILLFDTFSISNTFSLFSSFSLLSPLSLLKTSKTTNLSKVCPKEQYPSTHPSTGERTCVNLPSNIIIMDLGEGNTAYACSKGSDKISFNENQFFDSGGYPVNSRSFECRDGVAFIEQDYLFSTIHCVSEETIFSPNIGGLTSSFEEKLATCFSKGYQFSQQSTSCRKHEWLNGEYCDPLTICSPDERQSKAPTARSDRVCVPIDENYCDPDYEFKSKEGCKPLTECRDGEKEVTKPTATSDRVCEAT